MKINLVLFQHYFFKIIMMKPKPHIPIIPLLYHVSNYNHFKVNIINSYLINCKYFIIIQ